MRMQPLHPLETVYTLNGKHDDDAFSDVFI